MMVSQCSALIHSLTENPTLHTITNKQNRFILSIAKKHDCFIISSKGLSCFSELLWQQPLNIVNTAALYFYEKYDLIKNSQKNKTSTNEAFFVKIIQHSTKFKCFREIDRKLPNNDNDAASSIYSTSSWSFFLLANKKTSSWLSFYWPIKKYHHGHWNEEFPDDGKIECRQCSSSNTFLLLLDANWRYRI